MKKSLIFPLVIFAMCGAAFAQSRITGFDKAREIKLLESTREDVKKILADYENDDSDDDESQFQSFSTKDAEIEIKFSRGDCSKFLEVWDVPAGIAAKITIKLKEEINLKNFKFDFSNYKKEIEDEESPETYKYHNEDDGIVFEIDDDEIERIVFYPTKSKISFLCNTETTSEFLSGEERLIDLALREGCELINLPANVANLILNRSEITIEENKSAKKSRFSKNAKVSVVTEATDAENDVLTYNYSVSGGKIVGQGAKVVWDLSGVEPGIYTITAGVDDGCGVCGQTITKTVLIKESLNSSVKATLNKPRKNY
ncbi:MAG TPA: hypothetical protein VF556_13210 [Pyrinomonadaceae bacterium]